MLRALYDEIKKTRTIDETNKKLTILDKFKQQISNTKFINFNSGLIAASIAAFATFFIYQQNQNDISTNLGQDFTFEKLKNKPQMLKLEKLLWRIQK